MLQRATSTPKIEFGTGHFELDIRQKGRKEHSADRLHPHLSDKDLAIHPNLELRGGFGIPVNQFWASWKTPRTTQMLQRATSTPKIEFGTGHFELDIRQKGRKEHSADRLHPHLSDKDLAIHPNLELRGGFGIPVNQFWTTFTSQRTTPMIQWATSNPKIEFGTGYFELDIPQKDRKEHSADRLHPYSSDKHKSILT